MARTTPQAAAEKWASRLSGATQQIQAGVQAVTVAPGQKAAAASQLWLQRVQASQAKWARNVGAVTLADWQDAMLNKGVGRIASGATAAVPKMQAFMTEFLSYLDAGKSRIDAMPKGDINASIARAAAQIQYNSQFKRSR